MVITWMTLHFPPTKKHQPSSIKTRTPRRRDKSYRYIKYRTTTSIMTPPNCTTDSNETVGPTLATTTDEHIALPLEDLKIACNAKLEVRMVEQRRIADKAAILSAFKPELLSKVQEHIQILEQMEHKKEDLSVFKQEMLEKVQSHVEELERQNSKQATLAVFKQELLTKVTDHLEMLDQAQHVAEDLSKFKAELLEKVAEHVEDINRAEAKREDVALFRSEMLDKVASMRLNTTEVEDAATTSS